MAHGFDATIADFREWIQTEPAVKGFEFPVFEYQKIVDQRLGVPSVPASSVPGETKTDPKGDPQVLKIGMAIRKFTGWPPPNPAKVAELIATYGFADVSGAVYAHLSDEKGAAVHTAENVRKAKQFLSEGGALVFITEYRTKYRQNTIAAMMQAGKITKEYATAWYDAEPDQTRRQWSAALLIAVKKAKAQQQVEAAQQADAAEEYKQTCEAELEKLPTNYSVSLDDWFLTHPKPQGYRFDWEETQTRIRDRRAFEITYAICSECGRQSMTLAEGKYLCKVCDRETIPVLPGTVEAAAAKQKEKS